MIFARGTILDTVQHKKKISDQASAYAQRENKEALEKSIAGGLACKRLVQSSRQERQL